MDVYAGGRKCYFIGNLRVAGGGVGAYLCSLSLHRVVLRTWGRRYIPKNMKRKGPGDRGRLFV